MAGAGCGDGAAVVAIQRKQPCVRGSRTAKDCTLDKGSNLHAVHDAVLTSTLPQESIIHDRDSQIFIRAGNGAFVLNVNLRCDSVEAVKHMIEEREGFPVKDQYLTVGGKPLRLGTFLREYDALLGDQSTIDVSLRVRGGHWTREMTLRELIIPERPLTSAVSIPRQQPPVTVLVLTEFGHRILHGVLSCFLKAHRAGLTYNGSCRMQDLWVRVHEGTTEVVVSRVDVGAGKVPAPPLDNTSQNNDYLELRSVINELFPQSTLHVQSIYKLLARLASDIPDPVRRTQLLQAHMGMVSSPVAVATMCLNLKRFYDQLDNVQQITFQQAMEMAQNKTYPLHVAVKEQPLFKNVYDYIPDNQNNNTGTPVSVPNNQYAGNGTGMELFNFARNWFTHVPAQRWPRGQGTEEFTGLPHLDYIFTYHFTNFLPEALLQLYKNFGDHNLLTEVLVPFS